MNSLSLHSELNDFNQFGKQTIVSDLLQGESKVKTYTNEFWTAKQRDAHSLHEISYRACFKPQIPNFFIHRLTKQGDVVYDPFMGRGTTLLEAALCGRIPYGCDINPLSVALLRPRLRPPTLEQIAQRLDSLQLDKAEEIKEDLLVFFHKETLREICALREYFISREQKGLFDEVDDWIRMTALNRLTGHSAGFFSVYTLPPNQALSLESQRKINEKRKQIPPYRDTKKIIIKKTRSLFRHPGSAGGEFLCCPVEELCLLTNPANHTPEIPSNSVSLVVTSPPFLDVVDYELDNWMRCWFLGIDPKKVAITMHGGIKRWAETMTEVFIELNRVLKPGGHVAFEVGEVRSGKVKLDEVVLPCGEKAGLEPILVLINDQIFTKTANCWGVDNNSKGTNTNRIVLFKKES